MRKAVNSVGLVVLLSRFSLFKLNLDEIIFNVKVNERMNEKFNE